MDFILCGTIDKTLFYVIVTAEICFHLCFERDIVISKGKSRAISDPAIV